jgi:hemerythrin-like metal-binding protein
LIQVNVVAATSNRLAAEGEVNMSIEWDEKYRIGNDAIDAEHQELFRIAKKFLEASDSESKRTAASALRKYTTEHFLHEEMLMHEVGYPLTASHLKLHEDLITRLGAIENKIEQDQLYQDDLEQFINHWFIKHMAALDAPLVVYVKKHRGLS